MTYPVILSIFVTTCKWIEVIYQNPISAIIRKILGNGLGIVLGCVVMVLLERIFTAGGGLLVVIIVSSIMAIFILETLSPLFHEETPSHRFICGGVSRNENRGKQVIPIAIGSDI